MIQAQRHIEISITRPDAAMDMERADIWTAADAMVPVDFGRLYVKEGAP